MRRYPRKRNRCKPMCSIERCTRGLRQRRQLQPPPRVVGTPADWMRSGRLAKQLVDIISVDEIFDKRLQIVRAAIAVVDVVGVLPDIAAEDRGRTMHQRIFTIGRLGDFQLAVLYLQPAPARAELADAGGSEIGFELFKPAEVLVDLLFQTPGQLAAATIGLHPAPEVNVVKMLAGIVEHRSVFAE